MDIYQYDESVRKRGFSQIVGIDEAGRGPLAGPVVAAAVILKENVRISGLRDSKIVAEKERRRLYNEIRNSSLDIGIGIVEPEDIDRLNVLRATRLAMQRAVEKLCRRPDILIIDALSLPGLSIAQLSPIKAENVSASVAAASIVAKVTRDEIMYGYHRQYPEYNFDKHKGYSTRDHLHKIRLYGPSPIHRKTFFRVMELDLPF
ncbi:MAG: ribonuclease HII [Nitrospirota bacterium]